MKLNSWEFGYEAGKRLGNAGRWIVWKLPRRLVYWCAIRVFANATTGKHANQIVPELTALEALQQWDNKKPNAHNGLCPDCIADDRNHKDE